MKIIDLKLPITGRVIEVCGDGYKVKWHNCEVSKLFFEDIQKKKFKKENRYLIIYR